jgi:hypothetical protein
MGVRNKGETLDETVVKALKWANEMLDIQISTSDPSYLKIQALKAQAASLVASISARVDPSGMRGARHDRIGALEEAIKNAKAKQPN